MNRRLKLLGSKLKDPRYHHTVRVVDTAVKLAEKYGVVCNKAEMAAIFHDYAKHQPISRLKQIITAGKEDARLIHYHPELWHGPAAAQIIPEETGIDDEQILNAIRFHTTGRANMTMLEKVIYLADYIEPGRDFPGVEETRELAGADLNQAVLTALGNTIQFLVAKKAPIFPDTFEAYNSFIIKGGSSD